MSVAGVPNIEDVLNIADVIQRGGYSSNITVCIGVETKEILDKVNEDFFYRFTTRENYEALDPDVTEVNIKIGGIGFKYYIKENEDGND